jgi:hypothetical protein
MKQWKRSQNGSWGLILRSVQNSRTIVEATRFESTTIFPSIVVTCSWRWSVPLESHTELYPQRSGGGKRSDGAKQKGKGKGNKEDAGNGAKETELFHGVTQQLHQVKEPFHQ